MAKAQNIVHQYFKKQLPDGFRILVKVNPYLFTGTEITISPDGERHIREMEFDEDIQDDLQADAFETCSALEFNLYLSGLA
ncbi:MAG: hypothetical protein MUE95_04660 [Cyclobacteriaceae bacterium]|jgi:hypothetical protein|nr:hypothetical protein [Cyclobacteriaceae bacterium]